MTEQWHTLADDVRAALRFAGFTVDSGEGPYRGGVNVQVDRGDDVLAGVWVSWGMSVAFMQRLEAAAEAGTFNAENPDIALHGAITSAVVPALLAVLDAFGFTTRTGESDYAEGMIHVLARRSR